jgi:hypothetical protein
MIEAKHEAVQRGAGAFEDGVLVEFSDLERDLFGLARIGCVPGASSSILGLLLTEGKLVAGQAETLPGSEITTWDGAVAGGVRLEIGEPLRRWTAAFSDGDTSFEVEATAISEPIELSGTAGEDDATRRYEQLCEIRGEAIIQGHRRELAGVGRRAHEWGASRPAAGGVLRSLYAAAPDEGLTLTAVRPAAGEGHGAERVQAWSAKVGAAPAVFDDARVSTIYDRGGEIRKAGLELHMAGEEFPRRASGEARAAAILEAGPLKIAISFLRWSIQGAPAQGSYAVVSPA